MFSLSEKRNIRNILLALASAALLSACDDGLNAPSGGSAGDSALNSRLQESISVLQPFVGVYDLQDNWMGQDADEAFLAIRLTGNDGISEAVLIDFDDEDNCVPRRFINGEVRKDPFSNRVFLDDILQFTEAELSLVGNNLIINTVDLFDIDNDLNSTENVSIRAERLGVSENDLGNPC